MRERDPGQLKARDPKCKKMILEYQITTSFQPLISNWKPPEQRPASGQDALPTRLGVRVTGRRRRRAGLLSQCDEDQVPSAQATVFSPRRGTELAAAARALRLALPIGSSIHSEPLSAA